MSLRPPTPGLRSLHYDARSAAKVELVIQPGDTLVVSDDVAAQLQRSSPQFKDGTAERDADATNAGDATPTTVTSPAKKRPAKKSAAKPKT